MKCKKHGILDKDLVKSNGRCKICHRRSANTARNKDRSHINAKTREDRKLNPEKYREYEKRNRLKDPARRIETEIARRVGLTRMEYQEILQNQNAICAICGKGESRKMKGKIMRLTLDHCHNTGKIRQFLCHNCNTGIGKFFDDINLLNAAIEYLRRHR